MLTKNFLKIINCSNKTKNVSIKSENKIAESKPIMIFCSGNGRILQARKALKNFSKELIKILITNSKS